MATYITENDVLSRCPIDFASIFAAQPVMYLDRTTARTAQVEMLISTKYQIPITLAQSPRAYAVISSIIADFVAGDMLQQIRQEELDMPDKVSGYAGGILIARAQALLDKIVSGMIELYDALENVTSSSVTIDGLTDETEAVPFFTRAMEF